MEYSLETVLDHVKKQSFSDISKLVKKIMLQSILLDPLLVFLLCINGKVKVLVVQSCATL